MAEDTWETHQLFSSNSGGVGSKVGVVDGGEVVVGPPRLGCHDVTEKEEGAANQGQAEDSRVDVEKLHRLNGPKSSSAAEGKHRRVVLTAKLRWMVSHAGALGPIASAETHIRPRCNLLPNQPRAHPIPPTLGKKSRAPVAGLIHAASGCLRGQCSVGHAPW